MEEPSKDSRNELTKVLAVISEPLRDYWHGLSRWNRLDELVPFIKSLQPISTDLIKYMVGAALVSTVTARIIAYDEGSLEFVDIPIIDEIIAICFFIVGGFLTSLLFHKPMKLLGGRAEFRHTFLAATYVAVTFYPFFVLADGIFLRVAGQALPASVYSVAQLVYLATLLGKIHEVSYGKTYAVLAITLMLVFFVVLAVVLLLA